MSASQHLIDLSDLPQPFVDAIEAAVRAYRGGTVSSTPRSLGWAADVLPPLPDSFFEPLPEELLDLFEGKLP